VKLSFQNLGFRVPDASKSRRRCQKKEEGSLREIIKGASGCAFPGETLYIMGSSGAGKTSLLNLLSDRVSVKSGTEITGEVMINDKDKLNIHLFGQIGCYVMQDDILFSDFTPREALKFAASLKLHVSEQE
jgi:ABC-type multidrug transport system ATPase subunit